MKMMATASSVAPKTQQKTEAMMSTSVEAMGQGTIPDAETSKFGRLAGGLPERGC